MEITLSLPYNLSAEQWSRVREVFCGMDGWLGYNPVDNTPQWYGDETSGRYISASVEPSGLLIEAQLEERLWTGWISVLCAKLTLALQIEVRDAEI